MELIHAIPAGAAAPDRTAVGRAQNVENAHIIPIVAKVRMVSPTGPEIRGIALAANATAPKKRPRNEGKERERNAN